MKRTHPLTGKVERKAIKILVTREGRVLQLEKTGNKITKREKITW